MLRPQGAHTRELVVEPSSPAPRGLSTARPFCVDPWSRSGAGRAHPGRVFTSEQSGTWAGPDGSTQNEDLGLSPPVRLPTCRNLSAAPRPAQRLPAWASLTTGVPRAGGRPFSTQIPSCVGFPGNCKNPSTSECFLDPASSSGNLRAKQNRHLADAWRRARRQLWGSCLGHSRLTGTWTDCDSGCQGRGSVLLHTPWQPWGP